MILQFDNILQGKLFLHASLLTTVVSHFTLPYPFAPFHAHQILTEAGMYGLHARLQEHYTEVVLRTASRLQSWDHSNSESTPPRSSPCDDFGKRLYEVIQNLPSREVE